MNTLDFKLADIFQDHLILQAQKPVYIFGECIKGIDIVIDILGKHYEFTTEAEQFCFQLDPLPVIKDAFEFSVASKKQKQVIKDCLAGDVYLCTGQSNMQFTCKEAVDIEYRNLPELRFYEVPKLPYENAEKEFEWLYQNNPAWSRCNEQSARDFSAIGYLVGKDLVDLLDRPIGMVSCNMGDTTIFSWIDESELRAEPAIKRILDRYDQEMLKYSSYEEYNDYFMKQLPILMEFYGVIERGVAAGKSSEEAHADAFKAYPNPYLPLGPKDQNRPHGMYDMMLSKIVPFANKGILYYQGENDKLNNDIYAYGLNALVKSWRKQFRDEQLPFIICQIAGYQTMDLHDFESGKLRDRQAEFVNLDNLQYVVTAVDQGEESNIHPKNKNIVAKRFFQVLAEYVYQKALDSLSPVLADYEFKGNDLLIKTKYNQLKLIKKPGLSGFVGVINGETQVIDTIETIGNSLLIKNVSGLEELRYAYEDFPHCSIYTENELPLLPFRILIK